MMALDIYDRIARLAPALLVILPVIVTLDVLVSIFHIRTPVTVYMSLLFAVSIPLTQWVRNSGRKVQRKLWTDWGGSPLAIALANPCDSSSKILCSRAIRRLCSLYPDMIPIDDSVFDYEIVGTLAAAYARTTGSRIVAPENASYGFARNAYGIRIIGIIIAATCLIVLSLFTIYSWDTASWIAIMVVAFTFGWWMISVREKAVKRAGDRYANAVIRWLASEPI